MWKVSRGLTKKDMCLKLEEARSLLREKDAKLEDARILEAELKASLHAQALAATKAHQQLEDLARDLECPVCLKALELGSTIALGCGHLFCAACSGEHM